MFRRLTSAFNLVELISAIAIMAILAVMAVEVVPFVIGWAQNVSDQRTLLVLNDALTRYKCEGGNVNSLTLGVSIGRVISYLQSTITWAGHAHNVMQQGKTYAARSLLAAGTMAQYRFTQYNTYKGETLSATTPTSTYPYGQGVGYMANGGTSSYGISPITTSTGYWAWANANGTVTGPLASGSNVIPTGNTSVTFWSCSSSSTNPSGAITSFTCVYSNLTSINLTGLTALTSLTLVNAFFTSLDVSKNTALTFLECCGTPLTSLDVSKNTALTSLYCSSNNLGPIYLGGHMPAIFICIPQNNGYTANPQ